MASAQPGAERGAGSVLPLLTLSGDAMHTVANMGRGACCSLVPSSGRRQSVAVSTKDPQKGDRGDAFNLVIRQETLETLPSNSPRFQIRCAPHLDVASLAPGGGLTTVVLGALRAPRLTLMQW